MWSDKVVTAVFAMDESCRLIDSWREARKKVQVSGLAGGLSSAVGGYLLRQEL